MDFMGAIPERSQSEIDSYENLYFLDKKERK
jgi:hypothetical protein